MIQFIQGFSRRNKSLKSTRTSRMRFPNPNPWYVHGTSTTSASYCPIQWQPSLSMPSKHVRSSLFRPRSSTCRLSNIPMLQWCAPPSKTQRRMHTLFANRRSTVSYFLASTLLETIGLPCCGSIRVLPESIKTHFTSILLPHPLFLLDPLHCLIHGTLPRYPSGTRARLKSVSPRTSSFSTVKEPRRLWWLSTGMHSASLDSSTSTM